MHKEILIPSERERQIIRARTSEEARQHIQELHRLHLEYLKKARPIQRTVIRLISKLERL